MFSCLCPVFMHQTHLPRPHVISNENIFLCLFYATIISRSSSIVRHFCVWEKYSIIPAFLLVSGGEREKKEKAPAGDSQTSHFGDLQTPALKPKHFFSRKYRNIIPLIYGDGSIIKKKNVVLIPRKTAHCVDKRGRDNGV